MMTDEYKIKFVSSSHKVTRIILLVNYKVRTHHEERMKKLKSSQCTQRDKNIVIYLVCNELLNQR